MDASSAGHSRGDGIMTFAPATAYSDEADPRFRQADRCLRSPWRSGSPSRGRGVGVEGRSLPACTGLRRVVEPPDAFAALKLPAHLVPVRLGLGNRRGRKRGEQRRLRRGCCPSPPAAATRARPPWPGPRSRSPCCWRCPARRRSLGGCARARTSGAAVLGSWHGQRLL